MTGSNTWFPRHRSPARPQWALWITSQWVRPHISEVVQALARNGCTGPECSTSKIGRDGKVQLNLFDPDLSRVEFMEFTPTGETCCSGFTAEHPTPADPE